MKSISPSKFIITLLAFIPFIFCNCTSDNCVHLPRPYTSGILYQPKDEELWKCICYQAFLLDRKNASAESIVARFGKGLKGWRNIMKQGVDTHYIEEISYQYFKINGDCEYLTFTFNDEGNIVNISKAIGVGEGVVPTSH